MVEVHVVIGNICRFIRPYNPGCLSAEIFYDIVILHARNIICLVVLFKLCDNSV